MSKHGGGGGASPSSMLKDSIGLRVSIITCEGRNIIGTLRGCDNSLNIIVENAIERTFSLTHAPIINEIGLYLIRGDNLAIIGNYDEAKEAAIDIDNARCSPLKPVKHS